ncbi:MAG TPA: nuclear transport factor 2 family protein, partial [Pyrinomonadaceae bacterium]|nr:nuclear transport factor 2 family protein [Pyrinomonadaceae bacterium]
RDIRLVRQNVFPAVGLEAALAALGTKPVVVTWKPSKAGVARSGDLGYAYGTFESRVNTFDARPTEQGVYMRIWKKQPGGAWKIVLDITNPVRPPAGQ